MLCTPLKYITLLLFTFATVQSANAQSASITMLGGKANNVLTVGKANLVRVSKPANAKVKIARGLLKDVGNGEFYVTEQYCRFPSHDTITVYIGSEILAQKVFTLVYDGAPLLAISGKTCYDSITKNDLYYNDHITVINDSLQRKITSFDIVMMPRRGEMIGPMTIHGDRIPVKLLRGANLNFYDWVWITKIEAEREDGSKSVLKFDDVKMQLVECNNPKKCREMKTNIY